MARRARSARAAFLALTLIVCDAHGKTVAIVTTSVEAEAAAEHLEAQLDERITRRVVEGGRLEDILREARAGWPEDLVIVIDTRAAKVSVIRPSDGTILSRSLDPEAARAPYAVALAAAELTDLVKATPPPKAAPLPPPEAPPKGKLRARPAIWFGALLASNGDVNLFQPAIGADVQLSRSTRRVWYSIGVHGAGLVGRTRSELLVLPTGPDENASITYRRDEAALRAGIGHRQGIGGALGWLEVGVSRIGVSANDQFGNEVSSDARAALWFGLGGEVRYSFGAGLSLAFGGGGAYLPQTSSFFASPEGADTQIAAFEEGHLEVRTRLGLVWEAGR